MELNELILLQENHIDSIFYLDGIREWESLHRDNHTFVPFMENYILGRWWIFVHQN